MRSDTGVAHVVFVASEALAGSQGTRAGTGAPSTPVRSVHTFVRCPNSLSHSYSTPLLSAPSGRGIVLSDGFSPIATRLLVYVSLLIAPAPWYLSNSS